MLARTSLRSVLRPASRQTITSARWYSAEKPTPEETAEHVKETVEKVESAAEDVVKKVTDLEAQVKELKVSPMAGLLRDDADRFFRANSRTDEQTLSTFNVERNRRKRPPRTLLSRALHRTSCRPLTSLLRH